MKTFKMIGKDLQFDGQNNLIMVDGDDELIQSIGEILRTNLGEWFLNPLHGFDRFEVLGQKHDEDRHLEAVYEAILQEPRIERVENITFDFNRSQRQLNVGFEVVKTTGETIEGGVVI